MYLQVGYIKENYHPNACLQHVRNVNSGLKARTKILNVLEKQAVSAGEVARQNTLSYEGVMHHLWLLEAEGTVCRRGKKPYVWLLTGLGQKRLVV